MSGLYSNALYRTQVPPRPPLKDQVWAKGRAIPNYSSAEWRWDDNGAVLRYAEYGNRSSKYGWEIDHILPVALGGGDHISNLRPLHCVTNSTAGGLLGAALNNH
jgi:hypothetical protein